MGFLEHCAGSGILAILLVSLSDGVPKRAAKLSAQNAATGDGVGISHHVRAILAELNRARILGSTPPRIIGGVDNHALAKLRDLQFVIDLQHGEKWLGRCAGGNCASPDAFCQQAG
ncbi:hypothetical protein K3F48_04315 [Methylosinus sp. Sm6]|nr:hypothetical protein [Methylosinus sp. Sm6]